MKSPTREVVSSSLQVHLFKEPCILSRPWKLLQYYFFFRRLLLNITFRTFHRNGSYLSPPPHIYAFVLTLITKLKT